VPVKFNTNRALNDFYQSGGNTSFPDSLKSVLNYIQNDENINDIKQAAYLLATAKKESDYSLERYESDFLCGDVGVPYKDKPCQSALNYYRSSDGKKNYYDLGIDKNGLPYFGRGLIQLTGKENYKKYGDLIGADLVNDADKAIKPKNSYKIASEYLNRRTFRYVDSDLTAARKSVNGGTKGKDEVNAEYNLWLNVLKEPNVKFKEVDKTKKQRIGYTIMYVLLGVSVVGFAVGLSYATRKK
tara:strand:- start:172 stop:897 length:726 start_codon:yes stop_codon:yes gene_type:complete